MALPQHIAPHAHAYIHTSHIYIHTYSHIWLRDAHRTSDEALLQRQLLEARDAASRAEERAGRALRAKAAYKGQVLV